MDVVGEVMWSVASYLGALGDDPLHPFCLFLFLNFHKKPGDVEKLGFPHPLVFSSLFLYFFFSARGLFFGPTDGLGKLGICALERARFFL